MIYAQQRWLDYETGQFISEDPIMDGLNWYAYAGGNPMGNTDRTGLFVDEAKAALSESGREALRQVGEVAKVVGATTVTVGIAIKGAVLFTAASVLLTPAPYSSIKIGDFEIKHITLIRLEREQEEQRKIDIDSGKDALTVDEHLLDQSSPEIQSHKIAADKNASSQSVVFQRPFQVHHWVPQSMLTGKNPNPFVLMANDKGVDIINSKWNLQSIPHRGGHSKLYFQRVRQYLNAQLANYNSLGRPDNYDFEKAMKEVIHQLRDDVRSGDLNIYNDNNQEIRDYLDSTQKQDSMRQTSRSFDFGGSGFNYDGSVFYSYGSYGYSGSWSRNSDGSWTDSSTGDVRSDTRSD